jgi:hypothetical protein
LLLGSGAAFAAQDNMPQMPQIHSKATYTVKSVDQGETLQDARGFGDQAPMVRMMNLMMVGGSGYEGMAMNAMAPAKAPAGGQAMDGMQGMDMGQQPKASTPPKKANQPMAGMPDMAMSSGQSKASPATRTNAPYAYQLKVPAGSPHVGANLLVVTIQRVKDHQPAKGLKLKAQVYMTAMDMGTDEPRVKEVAPGQYQVKAIFAMQGAWAVKFLIPGAHDQVFNFSVNK